jgi:RNA polymerase-binding transcription factor DksA
VDRAEITRDLGEARELEAALDRLADGSYGVCCDCDLDIAPARLHANPAAMRCVECQRLHEKIFAHPAEPRL